jgi:hypothetical protein
MTNFLHWRKMTWAIVLWSTAMVTWLLAGDAGAAVVGVLWLVGMAGLGYLWSVSQPMFRRGLGFRHGFFVRPGRRRWRLVNFHRTL